MGKTEKILKKMFWSEREMAELCVEQRSCSECDLEHCICALDWIDQRAQDMLEDHWRANL